MITKRVIIWWLLAVLLFPVIGYVYAQPPYFFKVPVVTGVVDPVVVGDDAVGNVYFIEDNSILWRWHPFLGLQNIYVSSGRLSGLEVDSTGHRLYFIETTSSGTVLKRCLWTGSSCTLSTVYTVPSGYILVDYEVQFTLFQGEFIYISIYRLTAPYEAHLIGVHYPSGYTTTIQSYTSSSLVSISNLDVRLKFTIVSIFPIKILIEPVWIYILDDMGAGSSSIVVKVGSNAPTTLVSRPVNYAGLGNGRFTYLKGLGNTVYYIYTERSPGTSSFDGYIEMGKITNVLYGTPAIAVLYSDYLPYDIWRWFGLVDMFIGVYPSTATLGGYEVFTSLIFRDGQGFRYRLIRLYGNPITVQIIEEYGPAAGFEYYSFSIQYTGDLIYGRMSTDELIEAIR